MSTTSVQGEVRPSNTDDDIELDDDLGVIPLVRLRRRDRRVIPPSECLLGEACLVCQWRREGLLSRLEARVVREPASSYLPCRTEFCPGCNTTVCLCPSYDADEARAEHSYALGHDHGTADGVDNRPAADWLARADLDPEAYWSGYDDACAGLPLGMPAEPLPTPPAVPVL